MSTILEQDNSAKHRQSVMTFAVAKSLAVTTIKKLNQTSIKSDISHERADSTVIDSMVTAHLQEAIMNQA